MPDPAVSQTDPTVAAPALADPAVSHTADAPALSNSAGGVAVLITVLIGALVAVALGAFGSLHDPRFFAVSVAGFSSGTAAKAWLSTVVITLALFQLVSAFVMYRLIPSVRAQSWMRTAHVWSGRVAVLLSVPVAVHCLYALGFQHSDDRVLFHSLFGCIFYGVFVTKMLLLTRKGLPGWVIPVAGGLLFFGLVYVWLTSALWFFLANGLTF
jgi:magnesium-transporting ATPase (P-type)